MACAQAECFSESNGSDYIGTIDFTETGIKCQAWISQSPHKHQYGQKSLFREGIFPTLFAS